MGSRMDSNQPRHKTGQEHNREGQSSKKLNLEGQSLVLLKPLFWVGIAPPTNEYAKGF